MGSPARSWIFGAEGVLTRSVSERAPGAAAPQVPSIELLDGSRLREWAGVWVL